MNNCVRLRESCGLFIGDSIKFLNVIDGLPEGAPNTEGAPALPFPPSMGMAACFAGEPLEMSN